MATYVLESAEFDRPTGTMVLRVRGHQPIRLAVGPEALRDLKAAVQDGVAGAAGGTTPPT